MKNLMKTTAVLLAALALPAAAAPQPGPDVQDRLQDIAEAIELAEREGAVQLRADKQAFVQAAYLGINGTPLEAKEAKELGQATGTGLSITHVAEGGPAEAAGIKPGDVLVKLDDQLLINTEQFAVLIRTHQGGDTVTLQGLRAGEPIIFKPQLTTRELPALGPGGGNLNREWRVQRINPLVELNPDLDPQQLIDRIMRQLDQQRGATDAKAMIEQMHQRRAEMERRMQELRQQLDLDINDLRAEVQVAPGQNIQAAAITMMQSDDQHTIQIKIQNNQRHATIKQRDGHVLFDGLLPEDGQVGGLPEGVQHKLDRMLKNTRIKIQQNQPAPAEQPKEREQQVS